MIRGAGPAQQEASLAHHQCLAVGDTSAANGTSPEDPDRALERDYLEAQLTITLESGHRKRDLLRH